VPLKPYAKLGNEDGVGNRSTSVPSDDYRYEAFISYRHTDPDRVWAKWLHTQLETYRVPRHLVRTRGLPRRLRKIFRDEEELPVSSDLSRNIEQALLQSRFLIVICSPRTPSSAWVDAEVRRFRELGRHDRILAVLIEGEPSEAFPRSLCEIRRSIGDGGDRTREQVEEVEPLAADVRRSRRESRRFLMRMAKLRMLACILGVTFDDLRRREAERRKRQWLTWGFVTAVVLLAFGGLSLRMAAERNRAQEERKRAEAADVQAQRETEKAQREAETARRSRYFAQIRQAEEELRQGAQTRAFERLESCPADLRGWEWYRLRTQSVPTDQKPVSLQARVVTSTAAISPDGKWLTLPEEHGLVLWNLHLGKRDQMLDRTGLPAAFSPDGKTVVTQGGLLYGVDLSRDQLAPKASSVYSLGFSPNGRWIVLGTIQGIKAYDAATKQERWTVNPPGFKPQGSVPVAILFCGDSSQVITVSSSGTVCCLELATGNTVMEFNTGFRSLQNAVISPDGRFLTTVGDRDVGDELDAEAKAKVWERQSTSWRLVHTLMIPQIRIACAAFSSDGQTIATGGANRFTGGLNRTITLWDARTGKSVSTHPVTEAIRWIGFSPDGFRLVAAGREKFFVWICAGGSAADGVRMGHTFTVSELQFSPDSRRLVSRSRFAQEGIVWDVADPQQRLDFLWGSDTIPQAAISPDGTRLAYIDNRRGRTGDRRSSRTQPVLANTDTQGGQVVVCDAVKGTILTAFHNQEPKGFGKTTIVNNLTFSPDSRYILTGDNNWNIQVWDATTGALRQTIKSPEERVSNVAYDRHGTLILTTGHSLDGKTKATRVWDANRGDLLASTAETDLHLLRNLRTDQSLSAQIEQIRSRFPTQTGDLISPDPTGHYDIRFNTRRHDSALMVRSLETGAVVRQIPLDSRKAVAVSPNGRRIAFHSLDNTVQICDIGSGKEPYALQGHIGAVNTLAFNPDGSRLATGSDDQTVRIWDVQSGTEALTLHGHQGPVQAVVFSPDGRYIASGGEDKSVRIWDSGASR